MPSIKRVANSLLTLEDWWAVWLGSLLIIFAITGVVSSVPTVAPWNTTPIEAFDIGSIVNILLLGFGLLLMTTLATRLMGAKDHSHAKAFLAIYILAIVAYIMAQQANIRAVGFGYAFWALGIGLAISNTVKTPAWVKPALRSELYIKTGLVLLGAEVLFSNILTLGLPGLFVAWVVTPTVIIFMYLYGTRILKITNRSLVMVIAAATSVCGVSAAVAIAAATKAKKEDLTLAIGMSLIFTVLMMVLMPLIISASNMNPIVGAAWIGGTVDSTGAVVAAGALLGNQAEQIAAIVKMIQNTLIGILGFVVAFLWVSKFDKDSNGGKPTAGEIWNRFPKFIIGFVAMSLVFSFALLPTIGENRVAHILDVTSDFRGWLFCLAFVSIGLESSFQILGKQVSGGQPIRLYLTGQSLNLILTLLAAYLAFGGILFESISTSNVQQAPFKNVIKHNLHRGIDPNALFYTEIEGWHTWNQNGITNSTSPRD